MTDQPTIPDSKSIFQSKTFWTNLLGPVFLILATKYGLNLDTDTQGVIIMVVMSVANIVLRKFTNTAVTVLPVKQGA